MKGLFGKEFKKVVTGLPYLIFFVALLAFFFTQFSTDFKRLEKPQPGQADYGTKYEELPEIIMPRAFDTLLSEFSSNSYIAYPIGFYKNVRLNDMRQLKMAEIIAELSGNSLEQMAKLTDVKEESLQEYLNSMRSDDSSEATRSKGNLILSISDVKLDSSVGYYRFRELMESADRCIGGGSNYSDLYIYRFGEVPKTYQDALNDYTAMAEKDKMTGAYARLFCDYIGIVLGLFPVFVAVAMGLKDKSARVNELIYTRKASSFSIVVTRYLAMVVAMMIPVLLMAVYGTFLVVPLYPGMSLDYLAFIKYSFFWLMPTLMTSAAVGTFVTELTSTPLAIAVQGIWWYLGMFSGLRHMDGGYGWDLMLRHNTVGNTQVYLSNIQVLLTNRAFYIVLSILLVVATCLIYELKRKGRLNPFDKVTKTFRNSRSRAEA